LFSNFFSVTTEAPLTIVGFLCNISDNDGGGGGGDDNKFLHLLQ